MCYILLVEGKRFGLTDRFDNQILCKQLSKTKGQYYSAKKSRSAERLFMKFIFTRH